MNEAKTRAEHSTPGPADHQIGAGKPAILANGAPGWHSRGYLPHFDSPSFIHHITFHLADSLATEALRKLESALLFLPEPQRDAERRKRLDAWIDAGHGSCSLRHPPASQVMQSSFLNFDGQRYRLLAWVIMPNHAHVLIEPIHGWTVAKIVATWKKFTAREINKYLWASGNAPLNPFWHREYWDRFIRDGRHFQQTLAYIHNNPVKAGLVARPELWPWSSAFPGMPDTREQRIPGNAEHQFGKENGADPATGVPKKS